MGIAQFKGIRMHNSGTNDTPPDDAGHRSGGEKNRLFAIGLMCAAIGCFALLDTAAKFLAARANMPVAEVVWLRFFAHVVFSGLLFWSLSAVDFRKTQKPLMQWTRGMLMLGATLFNFIALKYLQLDQTITFFFLAPLIVAGLAAPLLGEHIGWQRVVAIIIGFCGILIVVRPGYTSIHWAVLFSLGATLCYALYNIATRYLAAYDSAEVTQFYTPLAGLILTLPFALFAWVWPVDIMSWLLVIAMGVFGGGGHWLLILAHRMAPAAILAPFGYTGLFHMVVLGYFIFGDVPKWWTLLGGAVVIASGLYLIYLERHRGAAPSIKPGL